MTPPAILPSIPLALHELYPVSLPIDPRLGPGLGTLYRAKLPLALSNFPYAGQLLVFAAQSSELYFSDRFCQSRSSSCVTINERPMSSLLLRIMSHSCRFCANAASQLPPIVEKLVG